MSFLAPSVGTPAYRWCQSWTPPYTQKIAWRLRKFCGWVAEVLFGCRHRHVTRPYQDRQTCLDCGAWRHYVLNPLNEDFSPSEHIFIGRWKKPEVPGTIPRMSMIDARLSHRKGAL